MNPIDLQGTVFYVLDDTVQESLQGESGAYYRGRVKVEDSELLGLPEDFRFNTRHVCICRFKSGQKKINYIFYKSNFKISIKCHA